jgi:hypothetical protein
VADTNKVQERNRELARKINEEARRDPNSPYANKFVGLVNGQVAVVADDADELGKRLREAGADPATTFWIEASRDYDQVEEVWGLR